MALGRRIIGGILATAAVAFLLVGPAMASGEDSKAAEDKTKKSEPAKKATDSPADKTAGDPAKKAPDAKAAPAGTATADTAECKPKLDFNTFEDLYGARDWTLQTNARPQADQAEIVWRDAAAAKPATDKTATPDKSAEPAPESAKSKEASKIEKKAAKPKS